MRALTQLSITLRSFTDLKSSNEVLAREGIDTLESCQSRYKLTHRSNEVLAREGIDTPSSFVEYLLHVTVAMRY